MNILEMIFKEFFLVSESFGRNFCKDIFCPVNILDQILEFFFRDLSAINILEENFEDSCNLFGMFLWIGINIIGMN